MRYTALILWFTVASVQAADSVLPDPMQPPLAALPAVTTPDEPSAPPVTYTLSAVKVDGRHRSAIINNQLVTVGDQVNGARVLKIDTQAVAIQHGETHLALRLNQYDFKHRTIEGGSP